jgi:hypothetical protein
MVEYEDDLDDVAGAALVVRFETRRHEVVDYSIVLVLKVDETRETIRVYDGAHGFNEMHRYTRRAGKQTGKPFHSGTLGEGMRAAIGHVRSGVRQMIEGWE